LFNPHLKTLFYKQIMEKKSPEVEAFNASQGVEVFNTFEDMQLKDKLLQGIFAYGGFF